MKVLEYKELEDGSAKVELEMSDDEKAAILELGLITLLKEYIKHESDTKV